MPALVSDIVNQTIVGLSQVPGVSTQVYASARILQYVQDAFDMCFQQQWWAAYTSWWTGTLDGTTGHLTSDIIPTTPTANVPITQYTNIRSCFMSDSNRPMRELPPRANPTLLTGSTSAVFKAADHTFANRPIIFYPLNAAGNVVMEVRQEPLHPFALTDMLYLDALMLSYGASYYYAVDDGTNPAQIAKFQALFMKRLNDMIAAESEGSLQLDPRFHAEQDQWWELP